MNAVTRCLAGLCLCLPLAAAAEVRAGLGTWRYDIAGSATDRDRTYDFQDDLELETSGRCSVLIEVDTGPGGWPDWAVSLSQYGAAGDHAETTTVTGPLGIPITTVTSTVTASAAFDDYEVTARYPWTWRAVRFAGGLTLRRLRGTVHIEDSREDEPSHQDYDELLPQLHARARMPLGKRLALVAAGYGIEYDGSSAIEWRAGAELTLGALLIEGGWQEKRYQIALGNYALDATLDGALIRAGFVWR